jgi:hypothetical protein
MTSRWSRSSTSRAVGQDIRDARHEAGADATSNSGSEMVPMTLGDHASSLSGYWWMARNKIDECLHVWHVRKPLQHRGAPPALVTATSQWNGSKRARFQVGVDGPTCQYRDTETGFDEFHGRFG